MDIYEHMVQLQLTVFEECFVWPQTPIKLSSNNQPIRLFDRGATWEAYPDFIALDLRSKPPLLRIVEVTKSASWRVVCDKVKRLSEEDYREKVKTWVEKALPHIGKCSFAWDFFVRQSARQRIEGTDDWDELTARGVRLFDLEEVFEKMAKQMP